MRGLIRWAGVMAVGSSWPVLEEREAELSGRAVALRKQLAAVEARLARVVVSRETYAAQLKTVRNRIARLAGAGILVRADRGCYELAEGGARW